MLNIQKADDRSSTILCWTRDLAIGHALIDEDHQLIFDAANRLHMELLDEPEHSIVGEVLVELIDHTGSHFEREENLMQTIGFPRLEWHRQEHLALMEKVNELHRRFMDGQGGLAAEVERFIRSAMVSHIMRSDQELGACLRESARMQAAQPPA